MFYSHQRYISLRHFPKYRQSLMHRRSFETISQTPDYVKTHCNDLNNPFHFSNRKWIRKEYFDFVEN